eukprot:748272-Hanusia_phi.AAC.5
MTGWDSVPHPLTPIYVHYPLLLGQSATHGTYWGRRGFSHGGEQEEDAGCRGGRPLLVVSFAPRIDLVVKRVSIFDQVVPAMWSPTEKPSPESDNNPSYEYAEKYLTTAARYSTIDNKKRYHDCRLSCAGEERYQPTWDFVSRCERFCARLYDYNSPVEVSPQPASHGWWLKKLSSGRSVRNEVNSEGGGKENGLHIPDPWGKDISRIISSKQTVSSESGSVSVPLALSTSSKQAKTSMLLQTTGHGLDSVSFGSHHALEDLNSYFDSLPTKDCSQPDCNYKNVVVEKKKVLVNKPEKFSTKDIRQYEREVLGYRREHEKKLENQELAQIGEESDKLVQASVNGFHQLESSVPARSSSKHLRNRHSKAYEEAKNAKGFVGYYDNVFGDDKVRKGSVHKSQPATHAANPSVDERLKKLEKLHSQLEAQNTHLVQENRVQQSTMKQVQHPKITRPTVSATKTVSGTFVPLDGIMRSESTLKKQLHELEKPCSLNPVTGDLSAHFNVTVYSESDLTAVQTYRSTNLLKTVTQHAVVALAGHLRVLAAPATGPGHCVSVTAITVRNPAQLYEGHCANANMHVREWEKRGGRGGNGGEEGDGTQFAMQYGQIEMQECQEELIRCR